MNATTQAARSGAKEETPIRIFIVDDHPIVRFGLSTLVSSQRDMQVAGTADDGNAAIAQLQQDPADVVLLDLRMPGLTGTETLTRIRSIAPRTACIIVSSFEYDEEIYSAVQAGACGYVHKEAPAEEILRAIRLASLGKSAFPKRIADRLASRHMTAGLSSRELEILQLVARGLTNKEVAQTLAISRFTVRNHLNHITQKLEASDRTEAIFLALQTGLITPP